MCASLPRRMAGCVVLIAGLLPLVSSGAELVRAERKVFSFRDTETNNDREFSSAPSACAAYVQSRREGSTFTKLDEYKEGDTSVRCLWKRKDGDTDGQVAVSVTVRCPANANSTNPDAVATMQCECDHSFVSRGGRCVKDEGGGSSSTAALPAAPSAQAPPKGPDPKCPPIDHRLQASGALRAAAREIHDVADLYPSDIKSPRRQKSPIGRTQSTVALAEVVLADSCRAVYGAASGGRLSPRQKQAMREYNVRIVGGKDHAEMNILTQRPKTSRVLRWGISWARNNGPIRAKRSVRPT